MGTIAEMLERRGEERAEQRFLQEKEKTGRGVWAER